MSTTTIIRQTLIESGPNPPNYGEGSNRTTPPNYGSLVEELKDARQHSAGRGQYLQNVCKILSNTVGFIVILAILLVIPVLMIVVGVLNLFNCPVQRFIPIWLVVAGAVGAFQQCATIASRVNNICCRWGLSSPQEYGWNSLEKLYGIFNGIMGCFILAWFIAGSVWVYSIYAPNTTNPNLFGKPYCDHLTYYLAFSLLTIGYACILLFCVCSCCIAFVAGATSSD